jgi:hypothetical protein
VSADGHALRIHSTNETDTGTADDDLSFKKGDTVEVLDCATPRWRVRDSDGRLGCMCILILCSRT